MRRIDLSSFIGQKFGYLTFLKENNFDGKRSYVSVLCECGVEKTVEWENLKRGKTKSCGCKMYSTKKYNRLPLYKVWNSIKQRCNNPNDPAYEYYGGRGVRICKEWQNDFEKFRDWCLANGWEKGLHVDKDTKGTGLLYSPETCCILTQEENKRASSKSKINMAIANEIKKSTIPTRFLAKQYNLSKSAIRNIRNGKRWA